MSSMAAALMAGAAALAGPMPDASVVGTTPAAPTLCRNDTDPNAIVVCAQRAGPSPRLPMRDDRFAPGEVVHYASDGPQQDPGPPMPPNRLGQTIGAALRGLRSLVTGEDPGD